jgi:hypothetical protein
VDADKMSHREAVQAMKAIKHRHASGLASVKQFQLLNRKLGWQDANVKKTIASALIDALADNKWNLTRKAADTILAECGYKGDPWTMRAS